MDDDTLEQIAERLKRSREDVRQMLSFLEEQFSEEEPLKKAATLLMRYYGSGQERGL